MMIDDNIRNALLLLADAFSQEDDYSTEAIESFRAAFFSVSLHQARTVAELLRQLATN